MAKLAHKKVQYMYIYYETEAEVAEQQPWLTFDYILKSKKNNKNYFYL